MIRLLRRSRLLALVLLVATPGLGGAWLQAAHPCPVDTPWLAGGGAHGEHHDSGPAGDNGHGFCHCIGSCSAAAIAVLPTAARLLSAAVAIPAYATPFAPALAAPVAVPSDRLPPATAPPLA
ncbi:MAG: hypothetical protein ACREMX_06880 [Gemmatimonadales bacterium]